MQSEGEYRDSTSAAAEQSSAATAHQTDSNMSSPLVSPPLETEVAEGVEGESGSTIGKTQAAFVSKLYSMVEDPAITELRWTESGLSFIVTSPVEFSKCLHNYFKHNNWQSFVRQLNMYQFHKVNDVFHTANGNKGATESTAWEFKHTFFRRGCYDMLAGIKRKASKPTTLSLPSNGSASPREMFSPQPNDYRRHHPMYNDHHQDNTQHSIASIEASQRMLMDQNTAIFSTLRSYQNVLGGMLQMLGSGQCSPAHLNGLQQELHNMSNQLNHAQFPNRAYTHANALASPGPQWQSGGPDSPASSSVPIMSPQRDMYSPQLGQERDSYFRSPPLPQARQQQPSGHGTPYFRSPVIGTHEAKSPRWHATQLPPIPTPPMSDSSRDGRDPRDGFGSAFARPAMPSRGRSLQSLLNTDTETEDRKRRRQVS